MEPATSRGYKGMIHLAVGDVNESIPFSIPRAATEGRTVTLPDLLFTARTAGEGQDIARRFDFLRSLSQIAHLFSPLQSESIAPIRTKPERTYGQVTEEYNPGGDQIPFVLERLARDEHSRESQLVMSALSRFGDESGLFGALRVRKLGSKAGEPFQIMVSIGGRDRNLVDVGYGVSQALPVVVQSALLPSNQLLLIQQPEVHLHPRAQAALGTFMSELVANTGKQFVIESHSDFIIDRVRQEIANRQLPAKSVSILFFNRHKMETSVTPIRLDDDGNIVNAPACYRSFFLEEELNLLQRTERVPHR
jgi:hypothetical protein